MLAKLIYQAQSAVIPVDDGQKSPSVFGQRNAVKTHALPTHVDSTYLNVDST